MAHKIPLSRRELYRELREVTHRSLIEFGGWQMPRNRDAIAAFDELVEKGCDAIFLVSRLAVIKDAHRFDTWKGLTGFGKPKSLRTALKRLRVCADDVDRLVGSVIGKALLKSPPEHALPSNLRSVADQLEEIVKVIKPGTNLTNRGARADIVRHVEDVTGNPRDVLVAAVLDPALGCDAGMQKQWRYDNRHIIRALRRA